MPVRFLCQKFFRNNLAPFYQYHQRVIPDATAALSQGASPSLPVLDAICPVMLSLKTSLSTSLAATQFTSCNSLSRNNLKTNQHLSLRQRPLT